MKRIALPQAVRQGEWPRVHAKAVSEQDWELFVQRRLAVTMYIEGSSMREIKLRTKLPGNEVNRLVERFCSTDEKGNCLGELALVPYAHIVGYTRSKPLGQKRLEQHGGFSGVLSALLAQHPEIEQAMVRIICNAGTQLLDSRGALNFLISKFYNQLTASGITAPAWPYNTKSRGRTTLRKYLLALRAEHAVAYVFAHGEETAKAHIATGTGHARWFEAKRPLDYVQLDGHFLDAFFALLIEIEAGIYQWVTLDRLWLLVIMDGYTHAVLGYKLVFRSEVSAADVREVIAQACLGKWAPRTLENEEYMYKAGAGLPSGVLAEWSGLGFVALGIDSHLSNLAKKITVTARTDFGFQVCVGPIHHFEARADIERGFLETVRKVQQLPSSTGSHPHAGRAPNAQGRAIEFQIDLKRVEDAIDVMLANYNVKPSEGLKGFSPLGLLQQHFAKGLLVAQYTSAQLERLAVDQLTVKATVRGGGDSGRRPYIQLDRARYTNEVLASDFRLIGMELLIEVDCNDYRAVKAYLPTGASLGNLRVQGFWADFRHSVNMRRKLNSLLVSGDLKINNDSHPGQQICDYFVKQGKPKFALEIRRADEPGESVLHRKSKPRLPRADYFIQADSQDPDLPTPGQARNRG